MRNMERSTKLLILGKTSYRKSTLTQYGLGLGQDLVMGLVMDLDVGPGVGFGLSPSAGLFMIL